MFSKRSGFFEAFVHPFGYSSQESEVQFVLLIRYLVLFIDEFLPSSKCEAEQIDAVHHRQLSD